MPHLYMSPIVYSLGSKEYYVGFCGPLWSGRNRQLVTDEPVEFEEITGGSSRLQENHRPFYQILTSCGSGLNTIKEIKKYNIHCICKKPE